MMNVLMLNSKEYATLNNILENLEMTFGDSYDYVPATSFASCTCQGNCDGPTGGSTCQWG